MATGYGFLETISLHDKWMQKRDQIVLKYYKQYEGIVNAIDVVVHFAITGALTITTSNIISQLWPLTFVIIHFIKN